MEILIQAIKFDATEKLKEYLDKKVRKLGRISADIQSGEVYLQVIKPETSHNKWMEMSINGLNTQLFASKVADTFEQAADECIESLEKQVKRHKEKI